MCLEAGPLLLVKHARLGSSSSAAVKGGGRLSSLRAIDSLHSLGCEGVASPFHSTTSQAVSLEAGHAPQGPPRPTIANMSTSLHTSKYAHRFIILPHAAATA